MARRYSPRVAEEYFRKRLSSTGALLIVGPKWCGKTTIAEQMAASEIYLQNPDNREQYLYMANTKPSSLLEGEKPRLIDEWQDIPRIWDAIRFDVDRNGSRGAYILTGSSTPKPKKNDKEERWHSGTGRISTVHLRTMSTFEVGKSDGSISLKSLFDGKKDFDAISGLSLDEIASLVCIGGWPAALDMDEKAALDIPKDYIEGIINYDISTIDQVKRNPLVTAAILKSLSRNICTVADASSIVLDVKDQASRSTVLDYMDALKRLYVIEDIPSWHPSLTSKARTRSSPKRCFVDPSIAVVSMGAGPGTLIRDMPAFGILFESMCVRDLRVYSQVLDGTVMHYHDNTGLEVDIIVELPDGRWGAFEVKLNRGEDDAARSLLRLRNKISADSAEPSFLAVLTGAGFFHIRDDGVMIVPIGCLGP